MTQCGGGVSFVNIPRGRDNNCWYFLLSLVWADKYCPNLLRRFNVESSCFRQYCFLKQGECRGDIYWPTLGEQIGLKVFYFPLIWVIWKKVNTPPALADGFGFRLKAGFDRPNGSITATWNHRRANVDRHFLAAHYLLQQFKATQANVSNQNRITVFRQPYQVVLQSQIVWLSLL